jgi:membrane fusion protein (multidrug efflux system)
MEKKMNKKTKIATFILIISLCIILYYVFTWISFSRAYAITDAVFVKSDSISNLSFKRVGGRITKLYVKEGDTVKTGQLLAQIDDEDYKIKLNEITFQIDSLENEKSALKIKIEQTIEEIKLKKDISKRKVKILEDQIKALKNSRREIETNIEQLKRDHARYKSLYEEKAVPKNSFEKIDTNLKSLTAKKDALTDKINALQRQKHIAIKEIELVTLKEKTIQELNKKLQALESKIKALKEQKADIQNLIKYCSLISPVEGIVGKKFVDEGMLIKSGIPVFSIVDNKNLYIYALLEETKFKGVQEGNPVNIKIDAYPKESYSGKVEKIYPASAATYALIPRDISAGEFTKVAQRIPIRIKITDGDLTKLRVGMGGEIEIKRSL